MRGFNNNCSDLTGVVLLFWVDGGLWEIYDHLVASKQALLVSLAQTGELARRLVLERYPSYGESTKPVKKGWDKLWGSILQSCSV